MSALVERIIAARDGLRPLRMQGEESIRNPAVMATEVMADAANAIEDLVRALAALGEELSGVDPWWGALRDAADVAEAVIAKVEGR